MSSEKQNDIAYLNSLVTPNKRDKIKYVLEQRTRHITVVLENIEQAQNANAVIRTCDIFGVQDMHVVEQARSFLLQNTVAKGAEKWLSIYQYPTIQNCIPLLKKNGYRIIATTPHERGYTLQELPLGQKIALLFGTEVSGLSNEALSYADDFVTIPMFGFTESFNISVSVAICLYQTITAMRQSSIIPWQLSDKEKEVLQLQWLKKILHISKR